MNESVMQKKTSEMRERHRAEVERAERELALFDEFADSVSPAVASRVKHVHAFKPRPWVSMERAASLEEALALVYGLGSLCTVEVRKSGCTSIQAAGEHSKPYSEVAPQHATPGAVLLTQSSGEGFNGAVLSVYTKSGFLVKVEFPPGDLPGSLRDHAYWHQPQYGSREIVRKYGAAPCAWLVKFFAGYGSAGINSVRGFEGVEALRKALTWRAA